MRTYKRRSTYRRARRERVAELRARGLSLRGIAQAVGASHETVRRDLAATAGLSHLPSQNPPQRGDECDSPRDTAAVIPLRRTS
jgi:transposase